MIIKKGCDLGKEIRFGALKVSRSNGFYLSHGFVKTHEEEFDNYYVPKDVSQRPYTESPIPPLVLGS